MECTSDLRAEHGGVLVVLDVVSAMEDRMEAGLDVPAEDLERVLEFLRVFVDACHHGKEEGLLFPAIRAAGIADAADILERLEAEHVRGRELVQRIEAGLGRWGAGDASAERRLAEDLHAYALLLRDHIALEDDVLYPLAEKDLSSEENERLKRGYELIETDVVGQGRHEEFHAMIDRMRETYLRDEPEGLYMDAGIESRGRP